VPLEPKVALSLGMIIHELGTNAAKYGSLSVPNGSLEVSWAIEERSDTYLVIDWTERDGPPAKTPEHRGFGLTLIEREVSQGLRGKVRLEFEAGGLRANLRVPLASN
jgi:two-component sensor histidine kinase